MDNGMDNMLDMYLFETNSLLEQLDEILIDAEKVGEFTTDNVNEIFRVMHTIKGSSAMMEFSSLMTIAHRIEDLFFYIRENGMDKLSNEHKKELFNLMFRSTDSLRSEVDKVENNQPLSSNVDNFVSEINTFLNKISSEASSNSKSAPNEANEPTIDEVDATYATAEEAKPLPSSLPIDSAPYFIQVYYEESAGMENLRAFMLVTALKELELEFNYYPREIETDSNTTGSIIENGFFLAFQNRQDADTAVTVIQNTNNIHSYEILDNPNKQAPKAVVAKENSSVQTQSTPVKNQLAEVGAGIASQSTTSNKQSLISVNLSKLDSLMAIVGEIVITESMVTSSPELQGLKLDSFLKSSRQLRKLTDDLQDIAMSLRMVPISGVFQKMNRIVRDMKQRLNKDVRLTVIGEDTEVDKSVVDNIGDPLMHIVRNAMDHGIEETADERIQAGKSAQGEIILAAKHTGSEVVISITDDGCGVDDDIILAKAKRNGILSKPENEYSHREILNLLMAPGFSTNEAVTEFSGRGVGMDVVKKNVEALGGIVTLSSEKGKGTSVTLKIPLTMAIVDGMEVTVGKSIFTIPIANIRQSFKVSADEVIYDADGGEIVKRMDAFYPIVRIHNLYNIGSALTNLEDGILIWVEAGDKSYCLFVDELLGEQPVVVKPLPAFLNNFNIQHSGITGCTILGDGNISIILDILLLHEISHI